MTILAHQKAPESLRAISIHAPHAYAIIVGIKREEYRSQSTKYRGWALIHSSGSKTSDKFFQDYFIDPKKGIKRYAIIGAAEILDCTGSPGDYVYQIGSAIAFHPPIEGIKGQQSIFWGKSDKHPERETAFDQAWAIIQSRLKG